MNGPETPVNVKTIAGYITGSRQWLEEVGLIAPQPISEDVQFSALTAWSAEGARVGITTCLTCGAALLIDPRDEVDVKDLHRRFHRQEGAT